MRMAAVRWRRGVRAKRDAGYIFRCSRDGRPLELERRLRLGAKAGGLEIKGAVDGSMRDRLLELLDGQPELPVVLSRVGGELECGPVAAAVIGAHDDCGGVLVEGMKQEWGGSKERLLAVLGRQAVTRRSSSGGSGGGVSAAAGKGEGFDVLSLGELL